MTGAVSYLSERRLLALACRMLALEGLAETTLGHVSLRVDDTHLLVRGRRPDEHGLLFTTADDIALADLDGNLDPGEPPVSLPSELPIHKRCWRPAPTAWPWCTPTRPPSSPAPSLTSRCGR